MELTPHQDCGRPALSQGLVPKAKASAEKLIDILLPYAQAGIPVIGLEPSSVLTIRDDYPDLVPGVSAEAVAANIFLFDEYLVQLLEQNQRIEFSATASVEMPLQDLYEICGINCFALSTGPATS